MVGQKLAAASLAVFASAAPVGEVGAAVDGVALAAKPELPARRA